MKTHFKNIDKNIAMGVLYNSFINYITSNENGEYMETITIPRINLGNDIMIVSASYSWGEKEHFKFIDTDSLKDNSIYVMFDGMNQNGENKFWKISKETFSEIENFLMDCEEIMK